MRVLLYFEGGDQISKSGIGKALEHQKRALESAGIEYTLDPDDDFDVLHINTVFIKSAAIIANARKKGAAIIYHAHSTEEDFRDSFIFTNTVSHIFKYHIKNLYRKGDAIITPTPYSKRLLQQYGISAPIEVVSNGVDTDKFVKDEEKAEIFRRHFGLTKENKVVIASGLWIKRKGILDFIEVAKQLPDVTFIWFGETNLLTVPTEIRQAVTKDHPANVIFPGYMSCDIYLGAFSAADVFFFPSYEETEGIVTLEALSTSATCVLRDIPVYEGWMRDGYNCFIGKTNEDFVNLIRDKIEGRLPDVSENARKTALERSIPKIGQKLKHIYEMTQEDITSKLIREYARINSSQTKLNIGLFSDTFPPDVNGVSVSVNTLYEQLKKMGHNVYVITPTVDTKVIGTATFSDGILRIPGIKLKQLYGYRISRPYSIHALEYIKNMNLDVIHIHTEFSIKMLAEAAALLYNIPTCYTYHTMYEDYTHYVTHGHFEKQSKRLVGAYTKHIYHKECEIIAPSEKTKAALLGYGIKKQIHVVPTGIDTHRLSPENSDKEFVEQKLDELGVKDRFRIVYVGRMAPEKNIDMILRAMPKIKKIIPNAAFLVTGYGPSEQDLKDYVQSNGLEDTVFFLGKQPPNLIQNFYALGEVFVTASTSETQGLTYIEAMSSGLPVIAHYDECLTNILINGVTGFSFETEDEIVERVHEYYLMSEEAKEKMRRKAILKADEFSLDAFGNNIIKVYCRAIRKNSIKTAAKSGEITK